MSLKVLGWLLATCLLSTLSSAGAQQQASVRKIGWLGAGSKPDSGLESFRREFGKLGYVEGKNIAFEVRHAENKLERLPALADELIRLRVDVLLGTGTPETLALKNATRTIPIIFLLSLIRLRLVW